MVMMPREGAAPGREQLGALARLTHERATAEEIGAGWRARRASRRSIGARPRHRAPRAPRLGAGATGARRARGRARAGAAPRARRAGARRARTTTSPRSRPRSSATWSSRARTANASPRSGESPYEALLGDYDFGLRTQRSCGGCSARSAEALPPLAAEARVRSPRRDARGAGRRRSRRPSRAPCAASASTTRAGAWTSPPTPSPRGWAAATRASRPATATATSSRC